MGDFLGKVQVFSVETGGISREIKVGEQIRCLAWSRVGLLVGTLEGSLFLVERE